MYWFSQTVLVPFQCRISEGGFVPKSMYRAEWEKADNPLLMEESIYKTASVVKGSPHEVRRSKCEDEDFVFGS